MTVAGAANVLPRDLGTIDPVLAASQQRVQNTEDLVREKRGIVAVIPAYNEERFIASIVILALQHVEMVIVVDDGSLDQTAHLAKRTGANVIVLEHNQGKGSALRRGLARALEHPHLRAIVLLDADGQHDSREVPAVVQPILAAQADLVIGSRFLRMRSRIPWWRQIGQHSLTWFTNVASSTGFTDSQSGFRALSPRAARLLLQARSNGFSVESEMQFTIRKHCLRTMEVAITCGYKDPPKRNPFLQGLQVIHGVLRLVVQMRPLLSLGMSSMGLVLLSLLMGFLVMRIHEQTQRLLIDHSSATVSPVVLSSVGLSSGLIYRSIRALLVDLAKKNRQ